ncbi:MAG TPA: recombinase family protein [Candidatus Dojkabacteria bacterium]|nr:recombinase family protein [Candidatus Dojkabacteria bacterium]
MATNVGIYCRISSQKSVDKYSLPTQIKLGIEFCTKNKFIFQIYQEVESASSTEARYKFEELMRDITDGKVQAVWVVESSRFNRNMEDSIRLQKVFSTYNIAYYINGIKTELATAENKLSYHVQSAVNEYERSKMIERSVRGKSEWQNSGMMSMPFVYGYDYKYKEDGSKEWYINQQEAQIIKLIYKLYIEDRLPYNKIKIYLNDKGIKTKKGSEWDRSQISKILSQRLYLGQTTSTNGDIIESKVYPPIITIDQFNQAQQIRKTTSNPRNKFKSRKASHELTGIIKCQICGAAYFYNTNWKKLADGKLKQWERYTHSLSSTAYRECPQIARSLELKKTELLVANIIRDEFFENEAKFWEWWKSYQKKTGLRITELEDVIEKYNVLLKQAQDKKDKVILSISEGIITKADAKNVISKINNEIDTITTSILKTKNELNDQQSLVNDAVYKAISDLTHNFDNLSPLQRRELYLTVFKKISINNGKLTLEMYDGTEKKCLISYLKGQGKRRMA